MRFRAVAAAVALGGGLVACTTSPSVGRAAGSSQAPSQAPRPPAACLLDTATLATTTGLAWTVESATASDVRCVYDPAGGDDRGTSFVTVGLADRAAPDAATELDTLDDLCDPGSRTPATAGDGAFVCRFQSATVFGAVVQGSRVLTISASSAATGTTTAQLVLAIQQQLAAAPA